MLSRRVMKRLSGPLKLKRHEDSLGFYYVLAVILLVACKFLQFLMQSCCSFFRNLFKCGLMISFSSKLGVSFTRTNYNVFITSWCILHFFNGWLLFCNNSFTFSTTDMTCFSPLLTWNKFWKFEKFHLWDLQNRDDGSNRFDQFCISNENRS